MKLVSSIQEKYRKSNKLFLALKVLLSAFTIYFAVRVLFISISGLVSSGTSTDYPNLLLFGMLFSLGLSNAVELVEMFVTKKKEYFTLLLITTFFLLGVSVFVLWGWNRNPKLSKFLNKHVRQFEIYPKISRNQFLLYWGH